MKPILKWVGGKRWLVPQLARLWQPYSKLKLVEPFAGGMALSLAVAPKQAWLNDLNPHLINLYQQVANGLVINNRFQNSSDYYYKMRDKFNNLIISRKHDSVQAAKIFYFLIKTGFNGLCRFNQQGLFNVPFGSYETINYRREFSDYRELISSWQFSNLSFDSLELEGREFIYADPPYDRVFTNYNSQGFDWEQQQSLALWLAKHKGPVVTSNQATDRILQLYRKLKFRVKTLPAPRMISCNGNRAKAMEMLATRGI